MKIRVRVSVRITYLFEVMESRYLAGRGPLDTLEGLSQSSEGLHGGQLYSIIEQTNDLYNSRLKVINE